MEILFEAISFSGTYLLLYWLYYSGLDLKKLCSGQKQITTYLYELQG